MFEIIERKGLEGILSTFPFSLLDHWRDRATEEEQGYSTQRFSGLSRILRFFRYDRVWKKASNDNLKRTKASSGNPTKIVLSKFIQTAPSQREMIFNHGIILILALPPPNCHRSRVFV